MSKLKFPLVPLRGMTVFPYMVLSFPVGRQKSLDAIEAAQKSDDLVYIVMQKDLTMENPGIDDLYEMGTVAKVKQVLKMPNSLTHVIVEGISRGKLCDVFIEDGCNYAEVLHVAEAKTVKDDPHAEALISVAKDKQKEYYRISSRAAQHEIAVNVVSTETPGKLADVIIASLDIEREERQELLETIKPLSRLEKVVRILNRENQLLNLKVEIEEKVGKKIDQNQREYFLREQLKIIQKELGDKDGVQAIAEEYIQKAEKKKLPQYAKDTVIREAERLQRMSVSTPEANIIRNYVEQILELPWVEESKEIYDILSSEKILAADHYGLEKVKERILEFLAVRQNTKQNSATIICLVGPPGVGKTSVVKSIAKATGRNYVRMSLGGIKDESEIRGHRRTYIGAMAGRILNALKQAKTINPLILLDEVDKLAVSMNGDPAAALLEVLDGEQNNNFRDHYLEIPYDLSKVLFICTANDAGKIPEPLRDRMEIISLSGYTLDEKINIAIKHLYPKQLKANGLTKKQLKLDENIMTAIVENYTREAGVRGLERVIGKLCRKTVKEIVSEDIKSIKITNKNIEKYLGKPMARHLAVNEKPQIGVARGLAWTSAGGETLEVEVNSMKGTGKFELTGNMGDIMRESAKAAITYIRSEADKIKLDDNFYKDADIHIHIPEGAVPKDGPSAGITMATAIVSALTGVPVKNNVAMTGEITIRGRVLAIGGLKEKVIAAKQAGITEIILPWENKKDLEEISQNVKDGLDFVFVSQANEVFNSAITEGESIWK